MGTVSLLLFAWLAGTGLHLLARASMTVSAAARRKLDAEHSEETGGLEKVSTTPPPSSFRAVALVGSPRYYPLPAVALGGETLSIL